MFKEKKEAEEAHDISKQIWSHVSIEGSSKSIRVPEPRGSLPPAPEGLPVSNTSNVMAPEDWDLLLKGARTMTVKKNTVIVQQGEMFQRIYHINKGVCRTEVGILLGIGRLIGS